MIAHGFQEFSLHFYQGAEIQATCLRLQDGASVDVNMLLYLLFRARAGDALVHDDVARIDAFVQGWRADVVRPLRQARRSLKALVAGAAFPQAAQLRTAVKAAELQAKRSQQIAMEQGFDRLTGQPIPAEQAVAHNMRADGDYLGVTFPAQDIAIIAKRMAEIG